MRRIIEEKLLEWKNKERRKPLVLWGARQVGKTWSLQKFGADCFANTVYISFYNNSRIAGIFEQDYNVDRIINSLEIELHETIKPEETLLIFDEVQNAPKVVESLKYFCEEGSEYCVAAAGSLLGISIHEGISFPVGKVDELKLFPMSFREFLWAMDEEKLAEYILDYNNREVNDFSSKYVELLRQYMIVGGMPEVVGEYVNSKDYMKARSVQRVILSQYEGDFGKHVKATELPRIRMVWNSLPAQLAKENKKFFFGQIKKGARAKEFEIALQWLSDAGLIHIVHKVSKPAVPLKAYENFGAFKVYMNDVGLLGALSELDPSSYRNDELFVEFKGALTEQYVLQELIADTDHSIYYYASEKSRYEVDFIYQKGGGIVPLEVKAGINLRSKSLKVFCDKYNPKLAIRTSLAEMHKEEWVTNVPLWAVSSI